MNASPSTQLEPGVLADRHRSRLIGGSLVNMVDDVLRVKVIGIDHREINDGLISSVTEALGVNPRCHLHRPWATLVRAAEMPLPDDLPVN